MSYNSVSSIYVDNILWVLIMEYRRLNNLDFSKPYIRAPCSTTSGVDWKKLNWPSTWTARLKKTWSLSTQHRIASLAFALRPYRKDQPRSGCPSRLDDEGLRQVYENHLQQTTCQLAKASDVEINPSWAPDRNWICVQLSKCVPHQLTEAQCECCIEASISLLSFRRVKAFLNFLVIANEKWVL